MRQTLHLPNQLPKKLQGQVAIVTGAGRGIGAAAALHLSAAGAAVVLVARTVDQVDRVAKEIKKGGGRAIAVEADVSDPNQVEEIVESAIDQFGRVDILLNNAAVVWPIEEAAEADPDEWTYGIHVNLVAPFMLIQNVLPLMKDQKYGRILNITSGAAHIPIAGMSAYCASKAGLDMMTKVMALELSDSGICLNCLSPGMVDTDMQSEIRNVDTSESERLDFSHWHQAHETKKLLSPETVARHITWLLGPWGGEVTGTIFDVNDTTWQSQVQTDLKLA